MIKRCLILSVILGLVIGCGTRKKEVELQKIKIQNLKDIVIDLQNNITNNVKVHRISNVVELEPIDPAAESTYNGKTFKNAKITITDKLSDSTATNKDLSTKKIKDNSKETVRIKDKAMAVKTKKPNPWMWLGIVIICVVGLYLYFNKRKL
jgi:hypothetical protein